MFPQSFSVRLALILALVTGGFTLSAASTTFAARYCTPDQCDICDLCNSCTSCCNDPPELWMVYTRCLPKCCGLDAGFERISVQRYDKECCRWVRESYESFQASEAANPLPTLIFSHGNTLQHKGAVKQCWEVYNKLRCCPGQKRLVFWSWPAQVAFKRPILKPRELVQKNLKAKFMYAEYQGYYMAKFAQGMTFSKRVTLGGHSYGGIMAAAGAHYLGGGCLRGLTLAGAAPVELPNLSLAIISGAFDNDSMLPGKRYGQSFVAANKVLITRNETDKTLVSWPKISTYGKNSIGVTGINANRLGEHRNKLCQITMTSDVGKSHYISPHLKSGRLVNLLCCISFPECVACGGTTPIAADETEASEVDGELQLSDSDPSESVEAVKTESVPRVAQLLQD